MRQTFFYETPIGTLTLAEKEGRVTHLLFGKVCLLDAEDRETPLLQEAFTQLGDYFAGKRSAFSLPLSPEGTAFEEKVWSALLTIPYGETRSYGQIAAQISSPKACRAVGRANACNPISIFVPCHRVIGANGHLTGYGGGLERKSYLLELEGIHLPL